MTDAPYGKNVASKKQKKRFFCLFIEKQTTIGALAWRVDNYPARFWRHLQKKAYLCINNASEQMTKNIRIYRASAGSGKTYRLAYEYVLLLFRNRNEAHPHRGTLAVTFTNKATDEMKRRIVKELHALATSDTAPFMAELKNEPELNGLTDNEIKTSAQRFLTDILHDYSGFNVSTIDHFFQQIVRAFTREIGLQGNYGVELDEKNILQQAIDKMLFELTDSDPLLYWLQKIVKEHIDNGKSWRINKELEQLGYELFKESYRQNAPDVVTSPVDLDKYRESLAEYRESLNKIIQAFERQMHNYCAEANAIMSKQGLVWSDFCGGSTRSFAHYFDYRYLKNKKFVPSPSFLENIDNIDKWSAKTSDKKADIESAYRNGLNDIARKMVAEKPLRQYASAQTALENIYLLGVLGNIGLQIQNYCSEKNTMLICNTTDFLHKIIDGSDTPFVYEKAGVFLHHFMVDEFQDTSRMQWENFRPLLQNSVAENRQNLVVGDVKQSIYRWRNSDWQLLQTGVKRDFGEKNVEELQLDTNWRSATCVVDFNNTFFDYAPKALEPILGDAPAKMVQQLYNGVAQKKNSTTSGHVRMQFVPTDDKNTTWREHALKLLPEAIENLKDNGYQLSRITMLVRYNNEAVQVADFLLKKGYKVVSNEALLVASAPCVRLLTAMMRFYADPDNTVNRMLVESIYKAQSNETIGIAADNETAEAWLERLFGNRASEIDNLKNKPLFQLVETLIQTFGLTTGKGNNVFLQAFQDEIFSYTTNNDADINGFLEYWDNVSDKRYLAASETQDAIRIMTVHKSKGLEFEAVIIPFCEWDFEDRRNTKNIIWCSTAGAGQPFEQLPVVPVSYKNDLSKTIFADAFDKERTYNCIDVLNTAYVAFTRPKTSLCIIAPQMGAKQKTAKSVANLLEQHFGHATLLAKELADITQSSEKDGIKTIEIGQCRPLKAGSSSAETPEQLELTYDTISAEKRLKLRYMPDDEGSDRRYGLLMHDILGQMKSAGDLDKTLRRCIIEGKINDSEKEKISEKIEQMLSKEQVRNWFSGRYEVRNETEIITPSGKIYRPDRVMTNKKNVVVVDYKFGTQKQNRYHEQVSNYMRLIEKMGYQTEGYIWYTTLGEIDKVQLNN